MATRAESTVNAKHATLCARLLLPAMPTWHRIPLVNAAAHAQSCCM